MSFRFLCALILFYGPFTFANSLTPLPFSPTRNDFGGMGLMQMPNARAAQDGEFSIGATINSDYRHYHTALQLMPWLETTLRYTQTPNILYSADPNFSGETVYADKSIDLKFRLTKESFWLPETALGFRDIAGTGLFGSEFIAASKRAGPFDFTLGLGWGYIGNRGNFRGNKLESPDCGRDRTYKGKGGSLDHVRWFSGCASFFGGIEYQTPLENLHIKVEYDSNDYKSDFIARTTKQTISITSPFNFGLVYQFDDWGDLHASFERGNTWVVGFNIKTNFNQLKQLWQSSPPSIHQNVTQKKRADIDWDRVKIAIESEAGYRNTHVYADNQTITVLGSASKFRDRTLAHEKTARILLKTGSDAKKYQLIEQNLDLSIIQTNIDSASYRQVANQEYIDARITDATTRINPIASHTYLDDLQTTKNSPWEFDITPTLEQSFGGSENFYMFNMGITAGASYRLQKNLVLGGSLYVNFFDNYDKFLYNIPPDGTDLKRVRTLIRQYISNAPLRLNNLQLTAFDKFGDNLYTQAYAGYLETMFAGVGGEALYRTLNSHWAFGLTLNYVAQRDPYKQWAVFTEENQYDSQESAAYRVQTGALTGHLTTYYRPQWSGFDSLLIKASVGRYLAQDNGVTLDISKQFDSGIVAGVYFSKTDLSAEEFGEGSFNKGIYLSIPYDVFTINPSLNRAKISWTPLSRDGGQVLWKKYSLYEMTNARNLQSAFTNPSF